MNSAAPYEAGELVAANHGGNDETKFIRIIGLFYPGYLIDRRRHQSRFSSNRPKHDAA